MATQKYTEPELADARTVMLLARCFGLTLSARADGTLVVRGDPAFREALRAMIVRSKPALLAQLTPQSME